MMTMDNEMVQVYIEGFLAVQFWVYLGMKMDRVAPLLKCNLSNT